MRKAVEFNMIVIVVVNTFIFRRLIRIRKQRSMNNISTNRNEIKVGDVSVQLMLGLIILLAMSMYFSGP